MKKLLTLAAIAAFAFAATTSTAEAREDACIMIFSIGKDQGPPMTFSITTHLATPNSPARQQIAHAEGFEESEVNDWAVMSTRRICSAANDVNRINDACDAVYFYMIGALTGYGVTDCSPWID